MATDQNGIELPTAPLPSVSAKSVRDLLGAMEDLDAKHVPMLVSVFGDQGTGKTVAGMKLLQGVVPEDKKIVYVDTAMNFATLNNHPDLRRRTKYMEYENMEQLLVLAQALRTSPELKSRIGGVLIDEYSSAVKADRKWIVRVRAEQAEKDKKFKDKHHPSQADYLASQLRSEEVIQAFLLSGVHAVFIAHEQVDKLVVTRPDFAPGAANDFQRLIHGVYRATAKVENGKAVRKLQLQPTGRISVKNRIGGLGTFAEPEDIVFAYNQWGILEDTPTKTELTETEVKSVQEEQNALLALLNSPDTNDKE